MQQQIMGQLFNSLSEKKIKTRLAKKSKGEIVFKIIKSSLFALDSVPVFFNIGSVVTSLIDELNDTLDVDQYHVQDYKIEKALFKLFASKAFSSGFYVIIDNPNLLKKDSFLFLNQLIEKYDLHILLSFSNTCNFPVKSEIISQISQNGVPNKLISEVEDVFERPDNELICALFSCYDCAYSTSVIGLFEKYQRNIHVIMSFINGYDFSNSNLSYEGLHILRILLVVGEALSLHLLYKIFQKHNIRCGQIEFEAFKSLCHETRDLHLTFINDRGYIKILDNPLVGELIKDSFVDNQIIINDALEVFSPIVDSLTVPLLRFAITNTPRDYSRKKSFILELLKKQDKDNNVDPQYIDMVFSTSSKHELLYLCVLYYNMEIYDSPYYRIRDYGKTFGGRDIEILEALIAERLHLGDYPEKLESLVFSSNNIDEMCLLVSILFVSYLNTDTKNRAKYMDILENPQSKLFYRNFLHSKYYAYLLRNVSYYIKDCSLAIRSYRQCLNTFKDSDVVNYNRTISNLLCYVMDYDLDPFVIRAKDDVVRQIEQILEFMDSKYSYLSVNYGVFLMKYTSQNPERYFRSISLSEGTTETPYLFAQINLAVYLVRENPTRALEVLDNLELYIEQCKVIKTKQFYGVNRCLVEYANGICNTELLKQIIQHPLRGNLKLASKLYNFYTLRFKGNIPYSSNDWNGLYVPGTLFYRYFDPRLLLSTLDSPNCSI